MKYDQADYFQKIANQLIEGEPMLEDPMPSVSPGEVAAKQVANLLANEGGTEDVQETAAMAALDAAAEKVINNQEETTPIQEEVTETELDEDAQNAGEDENELTQEAGFAEELYEKVAHEMFQLGAFAKLIEYAEGGYGEEMQKHAFEAIDYINSQERYEEVIQKLASDLFSNDSNVIELFSHEGVDFVLDKVASFEELEKVANEGDGVFRNLANAAGEAIGTAKTKVIDAVNSVTKLDQISADIEAAKSEIQSLESLQKTYDWQNPSELAQYKENAQNIHQRHLDLSDLNKQRNLRMGGLGLGAATLVGGAALGGKALYDQFVSGGNPEEVLPHEKVSGTLDNNDNQYGGMDEMSNLTHSFLKLAGAAGLVGIALNENLDPEIRKVATTTFNEAAMMSHQEMGEEFIKAAFTIYSEDELHEIVANQHTPGLVEKVAFYLDANSASIDELEKVANADGVAAVKNVGAGLADAVSTIENTIGTEKAKTEGAGREYVGDLENTGKAGGGLVGGLEGYNVINDPAKYDVTKTASILEDAFLAKQAAAQTYAQADQIIKSIIGK